MFLLFFRAVATAEAEEAHASVLTGLRQIEADIFTIRTS